MQLEHSFSVPVGIDDAWRILIDIERIGPCMPGAAIESVHGDEFTGAVKVKLGPINLTYKGKAAFIEKDEAAHRAVIDARGRDARGNGTAAAKISATLHDAGGSTTVKVITDLDITGKPAQFGRGVMVDVGNKLLGQFADTLAKTLNAPAAEAGAAETGVGSAADAAAVAAQKEAAAQELPDTTGATPRPQPAAAAPAKAAGTGAALAAEDAADTVSDDRAEIAEASDTAPGFEPADDVEPLTPPLPAGGPVDGAGPLSSVNGHVRRSHHDVEPIDLLHHAGPAVAKRLAPVAVAVVIVLIAVRRHRRG